MKSTDKNNHPVSDELVREYIASIKPTDVFRVYYGRQGCMCGCRGKYRAHPENAAYAAEEQGYPISEDEISARSVTRILNKLKADPRCKLQSGYILVVDDDEKNRTHVAYIMKNKALCVSAS